MTLALIATLIMLAIFGVCAVVAIMVIAVPEHMPTDIFDEGDEDDH